jgi:endogenous inhibitor of DNA gyrase (YacG/DUF329 family)
MTGTPGPAGHRECPICGKPASAEAFPFCSKRCADVDLNRWLKGVYAIPADESPGGAERDEE